MRRRNRILASIRQLLKPRASMPQPGAELLVSVHSGDLVMGIRSALVGAWELTGKQKKDQ